MSSTIGALLNSDVRTLMQQVASTEIENIRGLPYDDVGTKTGDPQGVLDATVTTTVKGVNFYITREVRFITDPSYVSGGPYPANYRRVTVRVSQVNNAKLKPVELTTNVAGGAAGGSLDVKVSDLAGNPVPDVLVVVTNSHLSPNVNIDDPAIRTDSQGHILIPGLTPDATTSYNVIANKSGYNSDAKLGLVVNDGLPYTVVQLYCQLLSNLVVHVYYADGTPASGLQLRVASPSAPMVPLTGWLNPNPQVFTTDATGTVVLPSIRYSTDSAPYIINMISPLNPLLWGKTPDPTTCVLQAGANQTINWTLPPTTTTTTVPPTTTTTAGGTTTTTRLATLTVHVVELDDSGNQRTVTNASVTFDGVTLSTGSTYHDVVFSNHRLGTFNIQVAESYHQTYSAMYNLTGSTTLTVVLTPLFATLTVKVVYLDNNNNQVNLKNSYVNFDGTILSTGNYHDVVFSNHRQGVFSIHVERSNYQNYDAQYTLDGTDSITIVMSK